ncbi:endo alpha-1,4 polygalactosaminidase [Candidatus Woesearchaeota archaeon]|nr:endo alpha-1,4 polygalactosaminidase [Candidatus Woesearchaeota archaeon]
MNKRILIPTLFIILIVVILSSCTSKIGSNNNINTKKETFNINTENIENSIINNTWYHPKPGISWQWQLSGDINTNYKVDLYDVDLINTPQMIIDELHNKNIKVICYFSAGSWENYREDAKDFPKEVIGKTFDGWPDERWLDISQYILFEDIMNKRLDFAVQKKCDGVEPDNIDGYQNDNGFDLTYDDQINYNKWLANEVHKRNLSIALKNDLEQVKELVNFYDFAINEECFYYDECDLLLPFIEQDKAVLGVEYELETEKFCSHANKLGYSWMKKDINLDENRISC